jgi:hypothetical protein
VLFIETETEIFLKTIIPSRKATKLFRSLWWKPKHPPNPSTTKKS